MATASRHLQFRKLWLLTLLWGMLTVNALNDDCKPIAYSDVLIAAEITNATGNEELKIGDELGKELAAGNESEVFKVKEDILVTYKGKDLRAIVAENSGSTVIAFRGTCCSAQIGHQLESALDFKMELNFGGDTVKVMKFFWKALQTMLPGLSDNIARRDWKYIIAGHSLGGALASLLAIHMKTNTGVTFDEPSCLITFGAPRVGNKDYANAHDRMIPPSRKLRIVNAHDLVPHIPPKSVFGYKHHSREIWFGTDTTTTVAFLKVCSEMDPPDCSNGNMINLSKIDHPMKVYRALVDSPPAVIRDKTGTVQRSFEDALKSSCSNSVS